MVNTVGKKLQQARLSKHLSVEEAARVTRIRPDKLIDLEEDNYSNFPSMSYAKGFLLLYARYLDVDVRDFADSLHTPNPVSSDDYEYLNAAASGPPPPVSRRSYHPAPRRKRTILPVVVFAVLAAAVVLGIYLYVQAQRLSPGPEDQAGKQDLSSPTASPAISTLPAAPAPSIAPARVLRTPPPAIVAASPVAPPPAPVATPPPIAAVSPSGAAPLPPTAPLPSAAPAGTFDPTREVRRAEPVFPTPPAQANASLAAPAASIAPASLDPAPSVAALVPIATPSPLKQLSIRPLRKTWVTIRRDVADSPPFFQDWLFPGDPPLKLSGHKFWIQVTDPTAVQITQDGQPLPAGQSDIQIE